MIQAVLQGQDLNDDMFMTDDDSAGNDETSPEHDNMASSSTAGYADAFNQNSHSGDRVNPPQSNKTDVSTGETSNWTSSGEHDSAAADDAESLLEPIDPEDAFLFDMSEVQLLALEKD